MPQAKLSGLPARNLLENAIASDHELELNRDIFERVYRKRYKRAYAYHDTHGTIGRTVVSHCNEIISKHQLR